MEFRVERQILKLFGATIRTFDASRQLICRAEQKAFKLKEQIYFYADEAKTQPLFSIKARKIIDISATYDIFGADGTTVVASLQRKGVSSIFMRDQWIILDGGGQQVGSIQEDTQLLGLLRRYIEFVSLIVPQKYSIYVGENEVGHIQQNYNPFTLRYQCSYTEGASMLGDVVALAIPNLLAIIEGKQ